MQLLPEDKLIWSPVVANSTMNRARNASGINSYEQEFKFKPEDYLEKTLAEKGSASWLDLCCGQGNALRQAEHYFYQKNLSDKIKLTGIDLIDNAEENENTEAKIQFHIIPFSNFFSKEKFDLITCVHGLHYIGDKLNAIEKAISLLTPSGLFIANLDLANIRIDHTNKNFSLKDEFKRNNIKYYAAKKILKKTGHSNFNFGYRYLGADDTFGPNYTGQESVTSYYTI